MDQTFGGLDPGLGGQFQQAVARSGDIQHAQWDQTDGGGGRVAHEIPAARRQHIGEK